MCGYSIAGEILAALDMESVFGCHLGGASGWKPLRPNGDCAATDSLRIFLAMPADENNPAPATSAHRPPTVRTAAIVVVASLAARSR